MGVVARVVPTIGVRRLKHGATTSGLADSTRLGFLLATLLVPGLCLAANAGAALVAVGAAGTILSSADGTAWSQQQSGTSSTLFGIATDGEKWVAVGAGGTILSSRDNLTWSSHLLATGNDLFAVAHGDNQWVAVGRVGTVLTSPDGENWTLGASGSVLDLNAVAFGGGQWTAVGGNYAQVPDPSVNPQATKNEVTLISADAKSWTLVLKNDSNPIQADGYILRGTTYLDGQWVAVGGITYYGNQLGAASPWQFANMVAYGTCTSVASAVGQIVAVCDHATFVSADGVNWQQHGAPAATAIAHDGNRWVAVGTGGGISTSPDSSNWTAQGSGSTSDLWAVAGRAAPIAPSNISFTPGNSSLAPPPNSTTSPAPANSTVSSPDGHQTGADQSNSTAPQTSARPAPKPQKARTTSGQDSTNQPPGNQSANDQRDAQDFQNALAPIPGCAQEDGSQVAPCPSQVAQPKATTEPSLAANKPLSTVALAPASVWGAMPIELIGALAVIASTVYKLRRRIVFWFIWLFTRLRQDELLDHPLRAEIHSIVHANPGIHFREVARTVGREMGVVRHHLQVLVQGELIHAQASRANVRYFPPQIDDARMMGAWAAIQGPTPSRILRFVLGNPGTTLASASAATGILYATVTDNVRKLRSAGLIQSSRKQRFLGLYATELGTAIMRQKMLQAPTLGFAEAATGTSLTGGSSPPPSRGNAPGNSTS